MEKIEIPVNAKDIGIPSQMKVKKLLVQRTFDFLVRLRWKVLAHLKPQCFKKNELKTYGFRSQKFPNRIDCEPLKSFEKEIWETIKNVEFRSVRKPHMKRIHEINKKIDQEEDLIIRSDKTNNHYRMNTVL